MAGRIDHHAPAVGRRLWVGDLGAEFDGPLLGGIEVVDRKIEMYPLRLSRVGPVHPPR